MWWPIRAFTTGGISVSNGSRRRRRRHVLPASAVSRRLPPHRSARRVPVRQDRQRRTYRLEPYDPSGREGSIPFGTVIDMYDSFDTTNRYHAGEIGFLGEYDRGDITWSLLAKVGLGNMKQRTRNRRSYRDQRCRANR